MAGMKTRNPWTWHPAAFRAPASSPYLLLALGVIAAFIAWSAIIGRPDFPLDDAYITLHNARALLSGSDPNYAVSALIGTTSPVHLLLVAILGLAVDLQWANGVASWLAILAYLSGLLVLARRSGLSPAETTLLTLCGALTGASPFHLLNGLETGLTMAAVTWAIALSLGPATRLLPALLGLLPFIRPELALLSAALFAVRMRDFWSGGLRREIVRDAAIALTVATPWLVWMWVETGSLMPQTAAAKAAFFAEAAKPPEVKLVIVAAALGKLLVHVGPLVLGIVGLCFVRIGRAALLFAVATLVVFAAEFPSGLHHNVARYLYALVPLLLVGHAFFLASATGVARRCARILLIACAGFAAALSPLHLQKYYDEVEATRTDLGSLAEWIAAHTPATAVIAVHDAGYLAFATDRALVDIVGLKTPASRRAHEEMTVPSAGKRRGEAIARIIGNSRAAYLVTLGGWWGSATAESAQAAGVRLAPVRRSDSYQVYRILN